jgi:hypothetical protein
MSKFAVAGVSRCEKGNYRVRVANDFAGRIKILVRGGHTDVELRELPEPMTKGEVATWLKASELYAKPEFAAAIDEADAKYNAVVAVKAARAPKAEKAAKPAKTLDSLVARARAVVAPEWRDTEDAPF